MVYKNALLLIDNFNSSGNPNQKVTSTMDFSNISTSGRQNSRTPQSRNVSEDDDAVTPVVYGDIATHAAAMEKRDNVLKELVQEQLSSIRRDIQQSNPLILPTRLSAETVKRYAKDMMDEYKDRSGMNSREVKEYFETINDKISAEVRRQLSDRPEKEIKQAITAQYNKVLYETMNEQEVNDRLAGVNNRLFVIVDDSDGDY
jgi:hypothetical protein